MLKKFPVLLVFLSVSLYSQSARLESLSHITLFSDPSLILITPVYMVDFPDLLQASFNNNANSNATEVVGVKKAGDLFYVGGSFNNVNNPNNLFNYYGSMGLENGCDNLNFLLSTLAVFLPDYFDINADDFNDISNTPHLLLGASFSENFSIGFDLFYGHQKTKYDFENSDITIKGRGYLDNYGLKASLKIGPFLPTVAVSVPKYKIDAEIDYSGPDTSFTSDSVYAESDVAYNLLGGLQYDGFFNQITVRIAADYFFSFVKYDDDLPEFFTHNIGGILGIKKDFDGNLSFAFQDRVDFNMYIEIDESEIGTDIYETKTKDNVLSQNFAFGFEKKVTNLKRLDGVLYRFSLYDTYYLEKNSTKLSGSPNDYEVSTRYTGNWGIPVGLLGFGLEKSRFNLDLFSSFELNPSDWQDGILTGPIVAGASVTFNFNKSISPAQSTSSIPNRQEPQHFTPDKEDALVPDKEDVLVPDKEDALVPDEEDTVVPDEEDTVVPDEEDL